VKPGLQALALAALAALMPLGAQETPRNNRMVWFAIFPEPLPEPVAELGLEVSSQLLRPAFEHSGDGRTFARVDGEDWQLTWTQAWRLGPGSLAVTLRGLQRSGGIFDQLITNYHRVFGFPEGGREYTPNFRLDYRLVRDGVTIGDLRKPGFHVMDSDVAYVVPFGDRAQGARIGVSLQLPTGKVDDFSGSGGLDKLVGGAAWKSFGRWRVHGQAERVWIGLPAASPYRLVLEHRSLSRVWAGAGYQGPDTSLLGGLGLDITLAYHESPYHVGIYRVDRSGWQQNWTITHRALPRWRFGVSEDAGTFTNPDITAYVIWRMSR
jgi:hypothetical protein